MWEVVPIAAIVSAVVTLVIRWFDRPRAILRLEAVLQPDVDTGMGPNGEFWPAPAILLNVGDGDAFDVRVFGSECDPGIKTAGGHWGYRTQVIRGGDTVEVNLGLPHDWRDRDAAIVITWAPRPRRWWRKRITVKISDVGIGVVLPPGTLPLRKIDRSVRTTRALELNSARAYVYSWGKLPEDTPDIDAPDITRTDDQTS